MSDPKASFLERLTQLAASAPHGLPSDADARAILDGWRHEYADMDKLISRRFARLPVPTQKLLLDLLQRAQATEFTASLQQWSRHTALSLAVRRQALSVLESLGEPTDTAYRDALQQAVQHLSEMRSNPGAVMTDNGELQSDYGHAVLNLPLTLALDLSRELTADHPMLAVAIVRALYPIVDAHDFRQLVETLAQIPIPASVVMLQDMLAQTTDKSLNKTIKRALHRLHAQGLQIDESRQSPHRVVVGSVTHHLEKCLASHIDAMGDRVLWMIRTKPFGGYNIAYLLINYGTGIKLAVGLQASKRELPEFLSQTQQDAPLIELEPSYCQYQVTLAHQMNLETRTPVPEPFFALCDIIGEPQTTYDKAMIYSVLSESDRQEAEAYAEHADDLLELPEFAGWSLPAPIVQKYADQLREIEESQIVVSPALQRDRIQEVYAQAAEEALSARSRRIMRWRLEEMAYYLWQTERRREALWAVAAARSLETEDRDSLRRNPFAGALLERSLESAKARPGSRIIQPFSRPLQTGERSVHL